MKHKLESRFLGEIQNVLAGFRKGRRTKAQIANITWIIEKAREFQKKKKFFCFIDYSKPFDCMDKNKMENSSRDGNTRPLYMPPMRNLYASQEATVRIRQGTTD